MQEQSMILLATAIVLCVPIRGHAEVTYGSVRNGSFDASRTLRADDPGVVALLKAKWKIPGDLVFPESWGPNPNTRGGTLGYLRNGGWQGGAFVRLDGDGHLSSFFGALEPGKSYVGSVKVRGKGKVRFGAYEYGDDGQIGGATFVQREISTDKWLEYRGVYANNKPKVTGLNLVVSGQGPVDVDEVQFQPAELADVEITREMLGLYGTGALVEDPDVQAIRADEGYKSRLAEYHAALQTFRNNGAKPNVALLESVEKKVAVLEPYLSGEGKCSVLAAWHNDMVALTRVLKQQTGATVGPPTPIRVEPVASGVGYKPGERAARPGAVTITDVRSNKVRYNENEYATTVAMLVNTTSAPIQGTVIATATAELDDVREIARAPMTLNIGANKWSFGYSVGPETYGRAIDVRFLDGSGKIVDKWQEYYAVAAEWFRVMQHVNQAGLKNYRTDPWVTYLTESHWFASEPTDFGVQAGDFEEYLSPQVGYHMNMAERKYRIKAYKDSGVMTTIYQNVSASGRMGYEVIRKHPEFALYDANGQFAVDAVYGGYPNPMELASPIEIGPKRKVVKPYLDRKITPWGHVVVNTALRETVEFEANAIKEYAKHLDFDGIYIDGNMGVMSGYGYDGKQNMPTNKDVDFMKVNARNHRLFSEILKKDNPNFGTWYNWAYDTIDFMLTLGQKNYIGSGGKGDAGDETVRAAAVRNSMFLKETQGKLTKAESIATTFYLDILVPNRDQLIQKYGANMIMGYMFPWQEPENPGANRWGWPTLNCFGAQLVATQHRLAGGFVPSIRPWLQFQTRYSRYLWAPDVKVVPDADKIVQVSAPEDVSWKRFVYKRETAYGYDLIVHLVRMPATKTWDIDWLDEPKPLANVTVKFGVGSDALRDAWALRPYDFEENQQTVQTVLKANATAGSVSVGIPPFRYHTMVVFRAKNHN